MNLGESVRQLKWVRDAVIYISQLSEIYDYLEKRTGNWLTKTRRNRSF